MNKPTRALSIRQPWATAIAYGVKDVENRTWSTSFRGRILVHAGLRIGSPDHAQWEWERLEWDMEQLTGGPLPLGAYIGEVDIVDCIPIEDWEEPEDCPRNPWAWGPYCWVLRNAEHYDQPRPARGKLGLFRVAPVTCPRCGQPVDWGRVERRCCQRCEGETQGLP